MVNTIDNILGSTNKPVDNILGPAVKNTNQPSVLDNIIGASKGLAADGLNGIAEGTRGLVNLASNIATGVVGAPKINVPKIDPQYFTKLLGAPAQNGVDKFAQGLASYLPSSIVGGNIAGSAADSLGLIPKATNAAKSLSTGAVYGASNNPNTPVSSAITGADINGVIDSASNPINKALGYMGSKASDLYSYLNSPNKVNNILRISDNIGAKPDIGTAINHSGLSDLYNTGLASLPGTGVAKNQRKNLGAIRAFTKNIMDNMRGNSSPGDIPNDILDNVKNRYESNNDDNKSMFNDLFNNLDNKGFLMNSDEFPHGSSTGKYLLDNSRAPVSISPKIDSDTKSTLNNVIKNNSAPASSANISKSDDESDFQNFLNNSDINYNTDRSIVNNNDNASDGKNYTFSNIHQMISDMGDKASMAHAKGDMKTAYFYGNLKNAFIKDLNNKVSSIDPDAYSDYVDAKNDFANNVVPYRQNTIFNAINNKNNVSNLPQSLLASQNSKVYNQLSNSDKNKVLFNTMKKSAENDNIEDGNIPSSYSPIKVMNAHAKNMINYPTGKIPPNTLSDLNDLSSMRNIYNKAKENIDSPPNGYGGFKRFGTASIIGGAGLGTYALTHSIPSSLGTMAATIGTGIGAARPLASYLTNNSLKKAYINGSLAKEIGSSPFKQFLKAATSSNTIGGQQ